jgi:toxin ParE1/3/4
LTAQFRLSRAALNDIRAILAWSEEHFGEDARLRYEDLIVAGVTDAASNSVGRTPRPQLGDGVFSWHLSQSRDHVAGRRVRQPRHFLLCRMHGDLLVVGRIMHDAMDYERQIDARDWF